MPSKFSVASTVILICVSMLSSIVSAQQWPTRPVKIIVPFPPGQGADIITRIIAERLAPALGQQIIVDNRPGAGAALGTEMGAKSAPDGYTLLNGGSAALAINPHLYKKLAYDTPRDFVPVTQLVDIAMVFVVNPSLAVHSIQDLTNLAKRRPGDKFDACPIQGRCARANGPHGWSSDVGGGHSPHHIAAH